MYIWVSVLLYTYTRIHTSIHIYVYTRCIRISVSSKWVRRDRLKPKTSQNPPTHTHM